MPFSSDQFVDSVGLNVRMSYSDWPTTTNWVNPDPNQNIRQLLTDLGIRHLRDRIPDPERQPRISYVNSRLASLSLENGMKFIVVLDSRTDRVLDEAGIAPFVNWYASGEIVSEGGEKIQVRDMLDAIEGPNEYDRHNSQDSREDDWADNLNAYQDKVFQEVRNNPRLSAIPVVAPSLIYTAYCGSPLDSFEASADLGNLHPYPNYPYMRGPTKTLGWYLEHVTGCTGQLPIWATETGYRTVSDDSSKINERTAAKYTPRLLTEYFLAGNIQRTYLHEIARGTIDGWGLIAAEPSKTTIRGVQQFQLRPKPAYYAVKSLLQLLAEANWLPAERRWETPDIDLKPVNISFKGKKATTHHLLLQKSDRHYYLLLWQEVESYNPDKGNFEVVPDSMTVILPKNFRSVSVHQYDENFTYTSRSVDNANGELVLNVPDSVMVLEFSR